MVPPATEMRNYIKLFLVFKIIRWPWHKWQIIVFNSYLKIIFFNKILFLKRESWTARDHHCHSLRIKTDIKPNQKAVNMIFIIKSLDPEGYTEEKHRRGCKKTKITKASVCLSLVFSTPLHKNLSFPLPNPLLALPQLLPPPCHWSDGRLQTATNLFSPHPRGSESTEGSVVAASISHSGQGRWEMICSLSAPLSQGSPAVTLSLVLSASSGCPAAAWAPHQPTCTTNAWPVSSLSNFCIFWGRLSWSSGAVIVQLTQCSVLDTEQGEICLPICLSEGQLTHRLILIWNPVELCVCYIKW